MSILFFDTESAGFTPPERMTISQWACKYRELGRDSAVTGLYTLELTPFFGPIMDACSSPDVDEVAVCAPAQIGKTVALPENVSGYYTHQDPSGVFVILADEETATFVAVEKVAKMFRDSAALSNLYDKRTFNQQEITTANGGRIDFGWASSVAKLATRPKRIVIADEVDKPGYSTTSREASALSLLRERTKSYPQGYYKHIFLSTPTTAEGNITTLLDASDIVFDWHVHCPHCGQSQPLRWSNEYCHGFKDGLFRDESGQIRKIGKVVWEGGRNATKEQIRDSARYQCGECGETWTQEQKSEAVRRGGMVPRTEPRGDERRLGFHVNRLYSLMDAGRLETLVSEWTALFRIPKERRNKELQGFINSTLAEPWKMVVRLNTDSEETILKACVDLPPQTVPVEAVALTCFIDVQKYGFWFAVRAWANDYSSWLIHYGQLSAWVDVEELLFDRQYPVPNGERSHRIWRAAIDTGGGEKYENMSMTEETYLWLRTNAVGRGCRVWGTKGASKLFVGPEVCRIGKPLDRTPAGKTLPFGFRITELDTHKLKNIFHHRLRAAIENDGHRPAYLHSGTGIDYARQILAEELIVDDKGQEIWRQKHRDNHLLDCEIGCMALAEPEWEGGGVNLIRQKPPQNAPRQSESRQKSNYFGNLGGYRL